MGTGRKPKLTIVKDRVTHESKERVAARAEAEPTGCASNLDPPAELTTAAKREWTRVVKLYKQLNSEILNDLDLMMLAAYCESVAAFTKAEKLVDTVPIVSTDDHGRAVHNPYMEVMRKEGLNIARYAEQLCMSPVGRARMGMAAAKKKETADPMEAILDSMS